MGIRKILDGQVFSELTVIKSLGKSTGSTKYECLCSCGNVVSIRGRNLTTKKTRSCGCMTSKYKGIVSTKHGLADTRTYRIWKGMMARCYNKSHIHYKYYGGAGVDVCDGWLTPEGFYNYWGDIDKPLSIDRKENDRGYYPDNCKLSTPKEQANNRKSNVIINGLTLSQIAEKFNISYAVISKRVASGKSFEKITNKHIMTYKLVMHEGKEVNLSQLSRLTGIKYSTLMSRYNKGKRDVELYGS